MNKFLVVDGSKTIRRIFHNLLSYHKILDASNGKEALESVKIEKPDVAFIARTLTDKSGYDLATELKLLHPAIKIVLMIADDQETVTDLSSAIDMFLSKTVFDSRDLDDIIFELDTAQPESADRKSKTILVVDDSKAIRESLKTFLSKKYNVILAENGEEGVALAAKHLPSLITMDANMPVMDGFAATRMIRENPKTKNIPIVMLTAQASEIEIEKGFEVGVSEYLQKSATANKLVDSISNFMTRKILKKEWVLVVDDSHSTLNMIRFILEHAGFRVMQAQNPVEALGKIGERVPDLIVTDVEMPTINGFQFTRLIKNYNALKNIPIIVLTSHSSKANEYYANSVGADGFITKPFETDMLVEKVNILIAGNSASVKTTTFPNLAKRPMDILSKISSILDIEMHRGVIVESFGDLVKSIDDIDAVAARLFAALDSVAFYDTGFLVAGKHSYISSMSEDGAKFSVLSEKLAKRSRPDLVNARFLKKDSPAQLPGPFDKIVEINFGYRDKIVAALTLSAFNDSDPFNIVILDVLRKNVSTILGKSLEIFDLLKVKKN